MWEAYLPRTLPHAQLKFRLHYAPKIPISSRVQPVSPTGIDRMGYYLGSFLEISALRTDCNDLEPRPLVVNSRRRVTKCILEFTKRLFHKISTTGPR